MATTIWQLTSAWNSHENARTEEWVKKLIKENQDLIIQDIADLLTVPWENRFIWWVFVVGNKWVPIMDNIEPILGEWLFEMPEDFWDH